MTSKREEILSTEAWIRQMLDSFGLDSDIQSSVTFEEIGMDSLDKIEFLMGIEDKFGIDIPDDELDELETVQQLVAYVENHK